MKNLITFSALLVFTISLSTGPNGLANEGNDSFAKPVVVDDMERFSVDDWWFDDERCVIKSESDPEFVKEGRKSLKCVFTIQNEAHSWNTVASWGLNIGKPAVVRFWVLPGASFLNVTLTSHDGVQAHCDIEDLKVEEWNLVEIPFSRFFASDANAKELADIKTISLGVSDDKPQFVNGEYTYYFDDLVVIPAR